MSVKWEKTGKTTGDLTFDISQDEIKLGLDQAFRRVKKNLRVPGFRKGHVSRVIFDQYYGEEALYEDALNIVLPNAYSAAVKEAGIKAVGQPQIVPVSMDKDKDWTMKATVTVEPEVKLGDYKGIEVPKQNTRVYQKDIDAELDKRREQNAELVLKKGKAEKGDTVTIDYKGTIDDKPFEGGSAENYSLELGSGAFFATKIHEVKSKQLPKLDDEFAKDVDDSVDTLDDLKEKIKKDLKEQKEQQANDAIQEAAIEGAVSNATIDEIPDAMIQEDVDTQLNQYLGNMQRQGIDPQTYYKLTNTNEQQLRSQFEKNAAERVKTNLVLEAIVAAEDLKATKEEIDKEIKDLASEYNMDEKMVRNTLSDDMLGHDITVRKAMDLITDNAKQVAKSKLEAKEAEDKKESK